MQILKIKSSCFPALAGLPTRRDCEVPRMHGNRAITNPSAPPTNENISRADR